jgi:N-acetylglucosaminyl-diphospho-decaprenol L-rhamnosyltransferase
VTGVSVVIPHYGDPGPTLALIEMLRDQEAPGLRVQLIVSDDHSPDPFPLSDGVTVLRRESNGGFGSAVNTAVDAATEDLILILNSDLVISRSFVYDLVRAAAPWLPAVVSPLVRSPEGETAWTGRHFPRVRHQFVEWLVPLARWRDKRLLHEAVGHDTRVGAGATVVDWVTGAVLLLPTSEFRAVGGFDERYFMNSEEVDLQRRLRDRGLLSVVLASVEAEHVGGASSDPSRRRAWLVSSRMTYASKWGGLGGLRAALLLATGINFVWNVGRRGCGRAVHPIATARQELALLGKGTAGENRATLH